MIFIFEYRFRNRIVDFLNVICVLRSINIQIYNRITKEIIHNFGTFSAVCNNFIVFLQHTFRHSSIHLFDFL